IALTANGHLRCHETGDGVSHLRRPIPAVARADRRQHDRLELVQLVPIGTFNSERLCYHGTTRPRRRCLPIIQLAEWGGLLRVLFSARRDPRPVRISGARAQGDRGLSLLAPHHWPLPDTVDRG